jgi:Protein of unknown function (DUF998)
VATSRLVACGVLGVSVLLTVSTMDAVTRMDGYDPALHWISLLARGERAWLGTANLLVAGLLVLVSSFGFSRALDEGEVGRRTARLIAAFGIALLVAGAFRIDASPSYPLGSVATVPSISARVHGLAGVLIVILLAALCWTGAGLFDRRGIRQLSRACGALVLTSLLTCCALRLISSSRTWEAARAGAFQRVALVLGCGWIAAVGLWSLVRSRSVAGGHVPDSTTADARRPTAIAEPVADVSDG